MQSFKKDPKASHPLTYLPIPLWTHLALLLPLEEAYPFTTTIMIDCFLPSHRYLFWWFSPLSLFSETFYDKEEKDLQRIYYF